MSEATPQKARILPRVRIWRDANDKESRCVGYPITVDFDLEFGGMPSTQLLSLAQARRLVVQLNATLRRATRRTR